MAQKPLIKAATRQTGRDKYSEKGHLLGPLLCWAVVFADIGTSVYYTPGILYSTVGKLAGFFVFLTMLVFILLTLKYAEVTQRFPQGGGVVTVGAQAINKWVGALGGMFILVDYFLTAAISCLSGILYFSVVMPALGPPFALWITIGVLVLLGILNWVGVSESAAVSLVGAVIAFISDIAILVSVFTHISFPFFLSLFPAMFAGKAFTPLILLTGFAGSFLAFSGLESISQLSPVMKTPRKKVAGIALLLVVLTVGLTSPLLTMFSTILQPQAADNAILNTQLVSLLGGRWGGIILQTEVAISASALLIFASNTAIIGSYHVFLALARMEFFPAFVLKRNKLRGTPHYSIALATGIPIIVLILVNGNINTLGDLYAFGLLGAFTLTCLGVDLIRYRDRKAARNNIVIVRGERPRNGNAFVQPGSAPPDGQHPGDERIAAGISIARDGNVAAQPKAPSFWSTVDFWLGVLTTLLVATAWTTNLIAKPLATAFGGSVAVVGMGIAYVIHRRYKKKGHVPVVMPTGVEGRLPGSVLAILTPNNHNDAVIHSAIESADGHPVVFLYLTTSTYQPSSMREFADPYLHDEEARAVFGRAENLAQEAKIGRRFVYRHESPRTVAHIWQAIHPHDTVVAADEAAEVEDLNPDRVRYETTSEGKVAHLLKTW